MKLLQEHNTASSNYIPSPEINHPKKARIEAAILEKYDPIDPIKTESLTYRNPKRGQKNELFRETGCESNRGRAYGRSERKRQKWFHK